MNACIICSEPSLKKIFYTPCCIKLICLDCVIDRLKTSYYCPCCNSIEKPFRFDYIFNIEKNQLLTYHSKCPTPFIPIHKIEKEEREYSDTFNMDHIKRGASIIGIFGFIFYCCTNSTI